MDTTVFLLVCMNRIKVAFFYFAIDLKDCRKLFLNGAKDYFQFIMRFKRFIYSLKLITDYRNTFYFPFKTNKYTNKLIISYCSGALTLWESINAAYNTCMAFLWGHFCNPNQELSQKKIVTALKFCMAVTILENHMELWRNGGGTATTAKIKFYLFSDNQPLECMTIFESCNCAVLWHSNGW